MSHVLLEEIDNVYVRVHADKSVLLEMYDLFSFKVPGYQFTPKFKYGLWDGCLHLLNLRNMLIYRGLAPNIEEFCNQAGYTFEFNPHPSSKANLSVEEFLGKIILPKDKTPRDFQLEALHHMVGVKRCLLLSSTGSGKSLILYLATRYLLTSGLCSKMLIIVPMLQLVDQLAKDFDDYGCEDQTWNPAAVHKIYGGQEKVTECPIVVSTWQSLQRADSAYLSQFDGIIFDEVHLGKAPAIKGIMERATEAQVRLGTTGTLDNLKINKMVLEGLFGSTHRVSETRDLMDKGILANLTVNCLLLKHSEEVSQQVKGLPYADEAKFAINYGKRNRYLTALASKLQGNTLVLVKEIEHGKQLTDAIKATGKEAYFVHGVVKLTERNRITALCETQRDLVLVATYGVFQMGINIINLDHVIFAAPSKSKIMVLQSVGRCLRRGADKVSAAVYDVADDFTGGKKKKNYLLKHFLERYKYYTEERFKVNLIEIPF